MRILLLLAALFLFLSPAADTAALDPDDATVIIDGVTITVPYDELPGDLPLNSHGGMAAIDIVGGIDDLATDFGLAKGNSYLIDTPVTLLEAEFWLDFTGSQTLTFYVFVSPVEFGAYQDIHRHSLAVTGTGAAWYSSGALNVDLLAGQHYIIAVSWNGLMTYFFNEGDSQLTTFGSHTHGYAVGQDPLPGSIISDANDFAIYYQRLTTDYPAALEEKSWGEIKVLFR